MHMFFVYEQFNKICLKLYINKIAIKFNIQTRNKLLCNVWCEIDIFNRLYTFFYVKPLSTHVANICKKKDALYRLIK